MSDSGCRNETPKRVYSNLSEGDTVRFEKYHPGRGRQVGVGRIAEVDEDHPVNAFTRYRVEFDHGYSWVPANKISEVLSRG